MKIIENKIIPFKGFAAINLFGVAFARHDHKLSKVDINHESIHTAQMKEMLYLPFYVVYFLEWLIRIPLSGNAYRNISFEREAYGHQNDLEYLKHRRHYAWLHYIKKKH